jgi:hypothetical protein
MARTDSLQTVAEGARQLDRRKFLGAQFCGQLADGGEEDVARNCHALGLETRRRLSRTRQLHGAKLAGGVAKSGPRGVHIGV